MLRPLLRQFVLLAIRSSVAYRLCDAPAHRGTPPAAGHGRLTPAPLPAHA